MLVRRPGESGTGWKHCPPLALDAFIPNPPYLGAIRGKSPHSKVLWTCEVNSIGLQPVKRAIRETGGD